MSNSCGVMAYLNARLFFVFAVHFTTKAYM